MQSTTILALVHSSGARKVDEALQQLNDIPFDLWGGICCSATATATALLIECERNVAQMLPLLLGHAPRDAKGQRPNGQRGHQIWLPARRRRHSELQRRRWHAACGSKFVWPAATSREAAASTAASTSTSRCHNKPIKAATRRRQFQSSDFYWVPRINCLQCAPPPPHSLWQHAICPVAYNQNKVKCRQLAEPQQQQVAKTTDSYPVQVRKAARQSSSKLRNLHWDCELVRWFLVVYIPNNAGFNTLYTIIYFNIYCTTYYTLLYILQSEQEAIEAVKKISTSAAFSACF